MLDNAHFQGEKGYRVSANISSVDSELWDSLLINRKVNETEDNIICYFNEYQELKDELIDFMNLFEKEIIFDFAKIEDGDENKVRK